MIIGAAWLILRHPDTGVVEFEGDLYKRCAPTDFIDEALVLSCVYVMVLILLTLIFAAVTWDSKENHGESRWVLATCGFTVVIWIAWCIISVVADVNLRDGAIAIANFVNATAMLLCMYVRKIYLLRKYKKEVKEDERASSRVSSLSRGHEKGEYGRGKRIGRGVF